ncbi:MAG: hypothetical protein OXC13_20170 [Caldilineaceae bacterium]|nr:hypothetical protein [Caldilineaceae bacterium]
MKGTLLPGLVGTNPLGFLAALGVQVVLLETGLQSRLWWKTGVSPAAVVNEDVTPCDIAARATGVFASWLASPILNPADRLGIPQAKADTLKLDRAEIRTYLDLSRQVTDGAQLSAALVAEGSLDNKGAAKPTDLYFTAGQQAFLAMAREIFEGATVEDVLEGLDGPWSYGSRLPSLMWDVVDDRDYALSAGNPSKDKKLTNPGPEGLALLGLSRYPAFAGRFAGRARTLTQGCSGIWTRARFTWPLWHKPASGRAVKSLLAHASGSPDASGATERERWYTAWGVASVHASSIRRSSQGGYGTFGPAETVWQASAYQ